MAGGDVFLALAGSGPPSIWRTDGTPNGTQPVVAGAALGIGALVGSNGQRAYFAGGSGSRTSAVWATDGTTAGTVLLKGGLGEGIFFNGPDVAVVEGRLFFQDCHPAPGQHCDLWISEGTPETTHKIAEVASLVWKVTGSAGKFYFFASPLDEPRLALWRSDGTAAGTQPLRFFSYESLYFDVTSVGGRAVALAEQKLWVTDGSSVELAGSLDANDFLDFSEAIVVGAKVYFPAERLNVATTLNVWSSDGTVAGTSVVLSTSMGFASAVVPSNWVQQLGTRIYFVVPGPQGREPYALWWSSAQGGSLQPLACSVCSSLMGGLFVLGDELLFPVRTGDQRSLWAIDPTHVPRPVATYCSNNFCGIGALVQGAGKGFFVVTPTSGINELWVTDAATAGTMKLDTFPWLFGLYGSASADALLFGASRDLQTRTTLWMSRGTVQSTTQLTVIEGAGSEPHELRRAGSRVAFLACGEEVGLWGAGAHDAELLKEGSVDCLGSTDGFHPLVSTGTHAFFQYAQFSGHEELWVTAGTASSTMKLLEGNGSIRDIAPSGDDASIWTNRVSSGVTDTRLWRSDGTAAGTTQLLALPSGAWEASATTDLGGEIYFRANSPLLQIWRTDGTTAGLRQLTDGALGEFVYDPSFTRVGAFVFFAGASGIWRTNGTTAGTGLVVPIEPGDRVSWLHQQGGALLFSRTEDGITTLWRTQGTPATTQQVAAVDPTVPQFFLDRPPVVSLDGLLYFAADDGSHGIELWRTDGTTAGTVMVRDIGVGPVSGNPRYLVVANGLIYFTADDTFAGNELWVSDGTSAGTHLLQDIAPQAASSSPAELTVVGDLIYFSADDGDTGRELWALPLAAPEPCTPAEGRLCLHGARFRLEVAWRDFTGRSGSGHAVPLGTDTGYFWFFDSANVELTVKVLDGRGVNGHHWVFYGALSSVEYTLTVTDTQTGVVKRYVNPAGALASVADTSAFPSSGGLSGAVVAARTSTSWRDRVTSKAVSPTPCVATSSRLCLQSGRFAVEAVWQDFAGNHGVGTGVALTGDTGYFWFFGASNVEVVLKVLDGRPVNERFWVFYGALSSVEYTITVTDTETGQQKQYHNPSGRLASIADTSAF
ncbi:MAG TPA: ELWxxDGT repeat protein [Thermoanaerobaculia bacterium]|nr:ELWxxDGT repeat protein [Thermoanaerobaculia bacterium]